MIVALFWDYFGGFNSARLVASNWSRFGGSLGRECMSIGFCLVVITSPFQVNSVTLEVKGILLSYNIIKISYCVFISSFVN